MRDDAPLMALGALLTLAMLLGMAIGLYLGIAIAG